MLIIVPVRRRVTIYYCPRCKMRQRFFSWIPIRTPEWTCPHCGAKFQINASCLGTNWAYGFAIWGMPVTLILAELFIALGAFVTFVHGKEPFPRFITHWIGAFVVVGPMTMVVAIIPCFLLGFFAGLIYGTLLISRRRSESERPRPRRKKRAAEPDSD